MKSEIIVDINIKKNRELQLQCDFYEDTSIHWCLDSHKITLAIVKFSYNILHFRKSAQNQCIEGAFTLEWKWTRKRQFSLITAAF